MRTTKKFRNLQLLPLLYSLLTMMNQMATSKFLSDVVGEKGVGKGLFFLQFFRLLKKRTGDFYFRSVEPSPGLPHDD